jgi:hypothetical protein
MTLKKIDHKFTNPQLSYDAKPNTQSCIKLTFYFNKLPEVSYEQFYGHWSTVHADLTVAAKGFGLYKIQRYVQVSIPSLPPLPPSIDSKIYHPPEFLTNHQSGNAKARIQSQSSRVNRNQNAGI